jgi:hypothetical protein
MHVYALLFSHSDQLRSDQRPARQIKPSPCFLLDNLTNSARSLRLDSIHQLYQLQSDIRNGTYLLSGLTITGRENCPQHFVAGNYLI